MSYFSDTPTYLQFPGLSIKKEARKIFKTKVAPEELKINKCIYDKYVDLFYNLKIYWMDKMKMDRKSIIEYTTAQGVLRDI